MARWQCFNRSRVFNISQVSNTSRGLLLEVLWYIYFKFLQLITRFWVAVKLNVGDSSSSVFVGVILKYSLSVCCNDNVIWDHLSFTKYHQFAIMSIHLKIWWDGTPRSCTVTYFLSWFTHCHTAFFLSTHFIAATNWQFSINYKWNYFVKVLNLIRIIIRNFTVLLNYNYMQKC